MYVCVCIDLKKAQCALHELPSPPQTPHLSGFFTDGIEKSHPFFCKSKPMTFFFIYFSHHTLEQLHFACVKYAKVLGLIDFPFFIFLS